jgi:hydrogenase/urease accessory protein HupE
MKHFLPKFVLTTLLLFAATANAHEMSMAELQLREMSRGEFLLQWSAGEKGTVTDDLMPVWPEGCHAEPNVLHCGEAGLQGVLSIEGVGKRYSAALVKIFWLDGQSRVYTITAGQPTVHLYGSADDKRGMGEIASAYTMLGIEHILTGYDHLMFVISLLFLVGFNRRLFLTITAFTLAHSVTLACSALDLLTLRSLPVEASIALSIVLVAGEALHQRQTLSRQRPALVAFLFGLVHGLGFAGALKEIGLPENNLLVALLTFNFGVEVGQLITVAAGWVIWRILSRWPQVSPARTAVLYGIGSVAAYWSWLRIVAIFG